MTTTVTAAPGSMDPMHWLGTGSVFASAVLPGILYLPTNQQINAIVPN